MSNVIKMDFIVGPAFLWRRKTWRVKRKFISINANCTRIFLLTHVVALFESDSEYERLLIIQTPVSYKLNLTTAKPLHTHAKWDDNGWIQYPLSIVCYHSQRNSMVSPMVGLWRYGSLAIPKTRDIHKSGFSGMPNRLRHLWRNWTAEEFVKRRLGYESLWIDIFD